MNPVMVERCAQACIDAMAGKLGERPEQLAELDEDAREVLLVGIRAVIEATGLNELREAASEALGLLNELGYGRGPTAFRLSAALSRSEGDVG